MPTLQRRRSTLSLRTTATRRTTLLNPLRLFRRKPKPTPIVPAQISPFLALPAELRNDVYAYVLRLSSRDNRIELRSLPIPPLLCTCRQILHEAMGIYFAENYFVFTIRFKHRYWLEKKTVPPLNYIRRQMGVNMGPILDMRLDAWMPWIMLCGGRERGSEDHRINLAEVRRPARATRGSWVVCTRWIHGDIRKILRAWRPEGKYGPGFDEVLEKVVEPVWFYHKVQSSP
ncbi:hypothetical protein PRZ48_011168 [Zasmidium cellare]|uniref:Uncharacterized protein n=1 Tax=Zasmidium cellare TaxID=395010 RepID=A0ABR0EBI5_ZASCE|nr:hypothetical protein PRZ48_011168 [Zasmidium cellare]